MISMFLSAIALITGWPPNVIPCEYIALASRNGSITRSVVTTAPIAAYEEERPFAHVTMSGRMSYRSEANQWPSRPNAGDHLVGREQDVVAVAEPRGRRCQYPAGATNAPPAFCTGSMCTRHTVSGSIARIVCSRSSSR